MTGTMRPRLQPPLTPFVDTLPLPRRILAGRDGGELTVRIRAAAHRFHRDLPESRVWTYDGQVQLAIRFQAYSGSYMYHCHTLEHEDRDMMRPIVIMPAQLMPFMS